VKSDILVSVIIPCYNVEKYIDECVGSVINQSYKRLEIICIDNNSSDNTLYRLKQLKERYPKIIILEEYNQGASYARNRGLSIAKGKWIQFLDADDILLQNKIANQIEMLKEYNDISFIVGSSSMKHINYPDMDIIAVDGNPFIKLLESRLGDTCANLFSKEMIDRVGGWNVNLSSSQESNLMFEILKINDKLLFDKEIYTIIRQREYGQISQSDPLKRWRIYIKLRVQIIEYLKSNLPDIYKKHEKIVLDIFFEILRVIIKYDQRMAIDYYQHYFPKDYTPTVSQVTTKIYLQLFKIFGFSRSEYIIFRLKKILNYLRKG